MLGQAHIIDPFWETHCYSCQPCVSVGSQDESNGIVLFKEKAGLISDKTEVAS